MLGVGGVLANTREPPPSSGPKCVTICTNRGTNPKRIYVVANRFKIVTCDKLVRENGSKFGIVRTKGLAVEIVELADCAVAAL